MKSDSLKRKISLNSQSQFRALWRQISKRIIQKELSARKGEKIWKINKGFNHRSLSLLSFYIHAECRKVSSSKGITIPPFHHSFIMILLALSLCKRVEALLTPFPQQLIHENKYEGDCHTTFSALTFFLSSSSSSKRFCIKGDYVYFIYKTTIVAIHNSYLWALNKYISSYRSMDKGNILELCFKRKEVSNWFLKTLNFSSSSPEEKDSPAHKLIDFWVEWQNDSKLNFSFLLWDDVRESNRWTF